MFFEQMDEQLDVVPVVLDDQNVKVYIFR